MTLDWSVIGNMFQEITILRFGVEILPIALSLLLARAFTKTKNEFIMAFLLCYTITFILGWAKQVWILIVIAFLIGVIKIRGGSSG